MMTTETAPVYRHRSPWSGDTRVTADIPQDGETYTHWWTTIRGVRWYDRPNDRPRPATLTPCYADDEKIILRIPYVQGATRVFSDVLHDTILGQFLCGLDICGIDTPTTAHVSLSAPLPACTDDDDEFLARRWAFFRDDPRRRWLWDAAPTATDAATPPPVEGTPAPTVWCAGLAEDEIITLREEIQLEINRRENGGGKKNPVAAWMGELTTEELRESYTDLKNEIVKRGLNSGGRGQNI